MEGQKVIQEREKLLTKIAELEMENAQLSMMEEDAQKYALKCKTLLEEARNCMHDDIGKLRRADSEMLNVDHIFESCLNFTKRQDANEAIESPSFKERKYDQIQDVITAATGWANFEYNIREYYKESLKLISERDNGNQTEV